MSKELNPVSIIPSLYKLMVDTAHSGQEETAKISCIAKKALICSALARDDKTTPRILRSTFLLDKTPVITPLTIGLISNLCQNLMEMTARDGILAKQASEIVNDIYMKLNQESAKI